MLFSLARLFILSSHKQVLTGKHCVNFDCSCKYEAGLGRSWHAVHNPPAAGQHDQHHLDNIQTEEFCETLTRWQT